MELKQAADGSKFVALVELPDVPSTNNFNKENIPLILATQNSQTQKWNWNEATPASLFTLDGKTLEVAAGAYRKESNGSFTFLLDS